MRAGSTGQGASEDSSSLINAALRFQGGLSTRSSHEDAALITKFFVRRNFMEFQVQSQSGIDSFPRIRSHLVGRMTSEYPK